MHRKKPSAAMVVAVVALVMSLGGVSVAASGLINGAKIKPGTIGHKQLGKGAVRSSNLAKNAISIANLSKALQRQVNNKSKTTLPGGSGVPGQNGSSGATGATGPTGATGAQGPKGDTGASGAAGKDGSATVAVTSLGSTFVDHSDGTDGKSSMDAKGIELGGTGSNGGLANSNDYAGISTNLLNGLTPADISQLAYTESYTMPSDSHYAAPYFKFKLQPPNGSCGDTDVAFNPSVQSVNLNYSGQSQHYDVTAPTSTVGVNNDANPIDGPYAKAIHSTSNGASRDVSGDKICLTEIILGGGSAATNAKATIQSLSVATSTTPLTTYQFGSK